tara:strand:+ start:1055 stop:1990 length:936 start_codon:yes stop_codon:yes gene_type:complete
MLLVLRSQIEEVETVAAACHILYSITHDDAIKGPPAVDVENQLSQAKAEQASPNSGDGSSIMQTTGTSSPTQITAGALVLVLQWHARRRDVTRACVRSITNLGRYTSFLKVLNTLGIADPLLAAVVLHPHARDITESAIKMIKGLASQCGYLGIPGDCLPLHVTVAGIPGLLLCLKARPLDFELASVVFQTLAALVGRRPNHKECVELHKESQSNIEEFTSTSIMNLRVNKKQTTQSAGKDSDIQMDGELSQDTDSVGGRYPEVPQNSIFEMTFFWHSGNVRASRCVSPGLKCSSRLPNTPPCLQAGRIVS